MKLFSSSSSSSASSTAPTSDDSSSYIQSNVNSRGLIGMLRRLLCFNALPTHPFDHITDFSNNAKRSGELDCPKQEEIKGNPGIVARLMGLDSMPEVDCYNGNKTRPALITRSQSMNYADTRREELVKAKHRQIKSTMSFRKAPSFVEMETEDFFILSFEGGGRDNDLLLKSRKSDKGFRELKPRREEKCRDTNKRSENRYYDDSKENLSPNMQLNDVSGSKVQDSSKLRPTSKLNQNSDAAVEVMKQPKPICQNQSGERERSRRKKKEKRSPVQKVEIKSDTENSSPVSVLDYGDPPPEPQVPTPGVVLRSTNSNCRRVLTGELEISSQSSSTIKSNLTDNNEKADKSEAKCPHSWKNKFQNYAEMWEDICKLTKTETVESSKMYREPRQLDDFKDIGAAIGIEIFDQLISEFLELLSSKQDNFEL